MAQAAQSVFIVDDDESVRASLRLLLESAGHRAERFASAEEFLRSGLITNACCLILDIRMPGMGGLELKEYLESQKPRIPVIFITGHDLFGMEQKAMNWALLLISGSPLRGRRFSMRFDVGVRKRSEIKKKNRAWHAWRESQWTGAQRFRRHLKTETAAISRRARAARACDGETDRRALQPRLHLLLLPFKQQLLGNRSNGAFRMTCWISSSVSISRARTTRRWSSPGRVASRPFSA